MIGACKELRMEGLGSRRGLDDAGVVWESASAEAGAAQLGAEGVLVVFVLNEARWVGRCEIRWSRLR